MPQFFEHHNGLEQLRDKAHNAFDQLVATQLIKPIQQVQSQLVKAAQLAEAPLPETAVVLELTDWAQGLRVYEDFFSQMPPWAEVLFGLIQQGQATARIKEWQAALQEALAEFPARARLEITDLELARSHESALERVWLAFSRRRIAWARVRWRIANELRWWFKQAPLAPPELYRRFDLAALWRRYLEAELADFWIQETRTCQRSLALKLEAVAQLLEEHNQACWELHRIISGTEAVPPLAELRERQGRIKPELLRLADQLDDLIHSLQDRSSEVFQKRLEVFGRHFLRAGTWLLPDSKYRIKRTQKILEREQRRARTLDRSWANYWGAWQQDQFKDFQLFLLSARAAAQTQTQVEQLLLVGRQAIKAEIAQVGEQLESWLGQLEPEESLPQLAERGKALTMGLRYQWLPCLAEGLKAQDPRILVGAYLKSIEETLAQIPSNLVLLYEKSVEGPLPETKTKKVAFDEILETEVLSRLESQLEAFLQEAEQPYRSLVQEIEELDQLIDVNLGATLLKIAEKTTGAEENRELLLSAFSRAQNHLDQLNEGDRQFRDQTRKALQKATSHLGARAQELVDHEKLLSLQLRLAKAKGQARLRKWRLSLEQRLRAAWPQAVQQAKQGFQRIKGWYQYFQRLTGVNDSSSQELRLKALVQDSRERIFALPHVYRHLFRDEAIEDDRFFYARQAEMEFIQKVFTTHEADRHGSLVVVGEKAAGKSSLWNMAAASLFGDRPRYLISLGQPCRTEPQLARRISETFGLEPLDDLLSVEKALLELKAPVVVALTNLEGLFLRVPGGTDLIRCLIQLQHQTQAKVLWITFCGQVAWNYLDRVMGLSQQFEWFLKLHVPTPKELEGLILRRHKLSGFGLEFTASSDFIKSKRYQKISDPNEQQVFLKDQFFNRLFQASGGNIGHALFYWVRAIEEVRGQVLVIPSRPRLSFEDLSQLTNAELFSLQAVLLHDRLTAEDHGRIFRLPHQENLYRFGLLVEKGILAEEGGAFTVQSLFYRPLVTLLKSRNLLEAK